MFFVLERDFTHAWGGTSSILREHRSRNALQGHRACYFRLGQNPRLWGTFLAWGAQAVIRGAQPGNASPPRGAGYGYSAFPATYRFPSQFCYTTADFVIYCGQFKISN